MADICVSRPIPYRTQKLRFDSELSQMEYVLLHKWGYKPARRYWSFGYHTKSMARVFDAVPPRLSRAIDLMMDALQIQYSAHDAIQNYVSDEPPSVAVDEELMWMADNDRGYITLNFDPATQQRRDLRVNARLASFSGMHIEEMLARYAHREFPLPWTDLDFVRFFVHQLLAHLCAESESLFMRMVHGTGPEARAMLVRCEMVKVFDALGRIKKVKHCLMPITPDEYDAAARVCPERCLQAAMGDRRSGRQVERDNPCSERR
eukprot:CAMPEP_0113725074 /NCGR_PEP_ID=MMETSP0038_2-20120614/39509_1 /TAXON_ID=2898 /ORGANISM="Cryptomonas paramecium" /LENGTH=261 /DNA_ID=CAMNT_0000655199 /DNA_START=248 /DNA_END=1033 /DNA_ORIENTATION=+ /assembly_acc=CAM_ASM_000170